MMQTYPLSIIHASVRPESLPGADLLTFSKVIFCYFGTYLGAHGPKKASIIGIVTSRDWPSSAARSRFVVSSRASSCLAQLPIACRWRVSRRQLTIVAHINSLHQRRSLC